MFNILIHPADTGGCGFYRCFFPKLAAQTLRKDIRLIESTKFIPIPQFYRDLRLVRIQRQISNEQAHYILNFLKPLSDKIGFWLSYEIDDVIGMDDIPRYNTGWQAYQNPQFMQNVHYIMNNCDFVTVTCEALADYYHKKFAVPRENLLVVPNFIPKWWIGDIYDEEKITKRYEKNSSKRRIAFASSTTHFDIMNVNGGIDDFTHVNDFVRSTIDKYQWVFIGGVPQQLRDLADNKKLEIYRGFDLLNYPSDFNKLNVDLVVAPLQDNVFNRCKSNIKFIEMGAMGIPCICQDLTPYQKYTDLVFRNSDDLQNKIDYVFESKERYLDIVKNHKNIVDNGDSNSPRGWWLENNMDHWFNIFTINQKTLTFDLREIKQRIAEEQAKKNTLQPQQLEEITFDNAMEVK